MPSASAEAKSTKTDPSALAREIGKREPFTLPEHEAVLNILRTAAVLDEPFERLFRQHGLSSPLFNILRIVRGHTCQTATASRRKPTGVPLGEIGPQMITPAPDVTRLVDRLEKLGLAERRRSDTDRRVVLVRLLPKGRRLLSKIDPQLDTLHREILSHLSRRDLDAINTLMVKTRGGIIEPTKRQNVEAKTTTS